MSYIPPSFFARGSARKTRHLGYRTTRDALTAMTIPASDSIYNLGISRFDGVVAGLSSAKRPSQGSLTAWLSAVFGQFTKNSIDVRSAFALEHSCKFILYFVAETLRSPEERVNNMSPWCFKAPSTIEPIEKQQLAELSRCYPATTERLCSFLQQDDGWDGADGQPANIPTFNDVKEILICALLNDLREPEVVLGNDGSVGVVWSGSDWYIAHDFDGSGSYIVVAMYKNDVAASGVEKVSAFSADVLPLLKKYFTDDDRTNLQ